MHPRFDRLRPAFVSLGEPNPPASGRLHAYQEAVSPVRAGLRYGLDPGNRHRGTVASRPEYAAIHLDSDRNGDLLMSVTDSAGSVARARMNTTVSADTISLTLAEHAYSGNAQFVVKVDGTQAGGPTAVTVTVTAAVANGASQVFSFFRRLGLNGADH